MLLELLFILNTFVLKVDLTFDLFHFVESLMNWT